MRDDPRIEPLLEWNRLARENAENAIVASMFSAVLKTSSKLEEFSTWLLLGSAGVASFFIANSEKILPLLTGKGFLVGGSLLCLSCFFGLVAKMFAMLIDIGLHSNDAILKTFSERMAQFEEEELKIQDQAKFWKIELATGIRIERILLEFTKPLPKIVSWFAMRKIRKIRGCTKFCVNGFSFKSAEPGLRTG